jgi:hypothetical protein
LKINRQYHWTSISFDIGQLYFNFNLNSDRTILKKFEFGRYILESDQTISTSWTKGIYRNLPPFYIEFLQTSWFGEEGENYELKYSNTSFEILNKALETPLSTGWIEKDYKIDKDKYYKVQIELQTEKGSKIWNYALLDIGEQDMPNIFDKIDQWIRLRLFDSNLYKKRRSFDLTTVKPK